MARVDSTVLNNVRSFLAKLDGAGIHIHKAYIFGSWARGTTDKWSDVDVAVVSPQISSDRFEERVRLTKLAISIDARIEPLPFSVDDFSENDPLVRMIIQDGIAVAMQEG